MLGEATLDALGTFLGEAIRLLILFVAQQHVMVHQPKKTAQYNCALTLIPRLAGCGKNHGAGTICQVAMRNSLLSCRERVIEPGAASILTVCAVVAQSLGRVRA
jgi:hypothetical protein